MTGASLPSGTPEIDQEIIARVDHWFGGALVIAFKSQEEGRPHEPFVYLNRSAVLEGLGVTEGV